MSSNAQYLQNDDLYKRFRRYLGCSNTVNRIDESNVFQTTDFCWSLPVSKVILNRYNNTTYSRLKHRRKRVQNTLGNLDIDQISDLSRSTSVSPTALLLALVYLDRLSLRNKADNVKSDKVCELSESEDEDGDEYLKYVSSSDLFRVSLLAASKYVEDDGQDNEVYLSDWLWPNESEGNDYGDGSCCDLSSDSESDSGFFDDEYYNDEIYSISPPVSPSRMCNDFWSAMEKCSDYSTSTHSMSPPPDRSSAMKRRESLDNLKMMEGDFLNALDWRLHVRVEEFEKALSDLEYDVMRCRLLQDETTAVHNASSPTLMTYSDLYVFLRSAHSMQFIVQIAALVIKVQAVLLTAYVMHVSLVVMVTSSAISHSQYINDFTAQVEFDHHVIRHQSIDESSNKSSDLMFSSTSNRVSVELDVSNSDNYDSEYILTTHAITSISSHVLPVAVLYDESSKFTLLPHNELTLVNRVVC